jgi:septum formation protein
MYNIILASGSPRRKQLLQQAHIPFTIQVTNANEDYSPSLALNQVAEHIAINKAQVVSLTNNDLVIAADTVVIINNKILGKPQKHEEAVAMLAELNGQRHEVITGVALKTMDKLISFSNTTIVHFNHLGMEALNQYVKQYQPFDKAGAYAIQEWIGVAAIKKIEGCFYNVMGLPVSELLQQLKEHFNIVYLPVTTA